MRSRRGRWQRCGGRSRIGPALVTASLAGAATAVFSGDNASATCFRTGGAVVEAWAFGALTGATRSDSTKSCELGHVCQVVVASAGGSAGNGLQVRTLFNPPQGDLPPNLPFELTETIDYPDRFTNGAGGTCYPVNGTITAEVDLSSTLVLDFQGQACEMTAAPGEVIVDGYYIGDPASTGTVADLDAVGSIQIESPNGLKGGVTKLKASLRGQLLFGTPPASRANAPASALASGCLE